MKKTTRGFTLTEILLVVLLFVFVGAVILVVAQAGARAWGTTEAQLTTLTNAQRALDRIREELTNARQGLTCPQNALAFFPFNTEDGEVTYALQGGRLTRTQQGTVQVLAAGITQLTAVCANELVDVSLTVQNPSPVGPVTHVLQSHIWIRNPAVPAT